MIERAQDLTECGVRRLLAVFVKRNQICEWSPQDDRWIPLDLDGSLDDPTLIRPVPLRALLDEALGNNAQVDALDAKQTPRLDEIMRKSKAAGKVEGKAEFLVELLRTRGLVLDDIHRAQVARCDDEAQLQRWLHRALTAASIHEVFEAP
ncbi:MAG: hypothetical protein AAGF11_00350 [Myxococcota bacterium]